jgi:large subunit ribosomal protein L29
MKVSEIRDLRSDELNEKLEELEVKLFELRSQAVTENIANNHLARNVRKDIARVRTIMRERQLQEQD